MGSSTGTPSPRVAYASALGCKLDVDFATGRTASGAPATDNTGALNAFLATASAAHPVKLILDGPALVRGLVIAAEGYTTIEGLGWGTGIYLADGANQDAIRIGAYTGGQTEGQGAREVPPRGASKVVLRDFAVFGNGGRSFTGPRQGQTPANAPFPGAPGHAIFGLALINCTDVLLEHLRVVDAPCYGVVFANAADVAVLNSSFESRTTFQDGVHVDGPAERVRISGCRFATGDDAIALNAPEGFGGDIDDVRITDCVTAGAYRLLRVYTSLAALHTVHHVRRVVVAQCTGTTMREPFLLGIDGNAALPAPDQLEDILITGCSLAGPSLALVMSPVGALTLRDCVFRAGGGGAMVAVRSTVRALQLLGVTLLRVSPSGGPLVSVDLPGFVERLIFAGARVVDEGGVYPPLPFALNAGAPVHALRVEALDMSGITAALEPRNGFAHIGEISGAGWLGTGTRTPGEKVAATTLYLSAETGQITAKTTDDAQTPLRSVVP